MKSILTFALVLSSAYVMSAQIFTPVKWDSSIEKVGDNEYALTFTAMIDEGWFVYSANMSDEGPVPTTIEFDTESGWERSGKIGEEGKLKEGYDALFDMDVKKYANKVVFSQKITTDGSIEEIEGYLTYMTCNNERCLPPTDVDFTFELE